MALNGQMTISLLKTRRISARNLRPPTKFVVTWCLSACADKQSQHLCHWIYLADDTVSY
jgi:hypothetical protein